MLQVYLAQSEGYLKESTTEKYIATIEKTKKVYNAIKKLLQKLPAEKHKPLRAFIESQKENKIFSETPSNDGVPEVTLGLMSIIGLSPSLFTKKGTQAEANHTYTASPVSYSFYMRTFAFCSAHKDNKRTMNIHGHARNFHAYKPFIAPKAKMIGFGVSVVGTLFYAGYKAYTNSAESKPIVPRENERKLSK
ncbi:MAG: hypothetical protein NTZ86_08995 [Legionellales bacterium]|nr:hypothetical protein [Legionellales bacterium]